MSNAIDQSNHINRHDEHNSPVSGNTVNHSHNNGLIVLGVVAIVALALSIVSLAALALGGDIKTTLKAEPKEVTVDASGR